MQHQTMYRDPAGKLQWMPCPCGEDHGPSINEERVWALAKVDELERQLTAVTAERDATTRSLRLALRLLSTLRTRGVTAA